MVRSASRQMGDGIRTLDQNDQVDSVDVETRPPTIPSSGTGSLCFGDPVVPAECLARRIGSRVGRSGRSGPAADGPSSFLLYRRSSPSTRADERSVVQETDDVGRRRDSNVGITNVGSQIGDSPTTAVHLGRLLERITHLADEAGVDSNRIVQIHIGTRPKRAAMTPWHD